MATAEYFWMRRPVLGAMQYMGEQDLPDLRAWVATVNTDASEVRVTRIEPTGDNGGFQLFQAWIWDYPNREFLGPKGYPTDWVLDYYGQMQVQTDEQFNSDYEPIDPGTEIPPEPEAGA